MLFANLHFGCVVEIDDSCIMLVPKPIFFLVFNVGKHRSKYLPFIFVLNARYLNGSVLIKYRGRTM